MVDKKSILTKLPAVFQTITEEKFFNATVDQLFSKKSSERLSGFIGRRASGHYDPYNDFYIPEINKERTHYQLEPAAVSKNPETLAKTNLLFYQDMIDKIRSLGGNVGNHDRLFSGGIYSYSPPINADSFLNYRSYVWLPSKITLIDIEDIYLPSGPTATFSIDGANHEYVNDMRVRFESPPYNFPHIVSGVGNNIVLTPEPIDELVTQDTKSYPWDDNDEINGLDNTKWDNKPWDSSERISPPDYITIERGAGDFNAWSRTNKWYHISLLRAVVDIAGGELIPSNGERAVRPIIEFIKNIQIYGGGVKFFHTVNYIVKSTEEDEEHENTPLVPTFDTINGVLYSTVSAIPGLEDLLDGDTMVFMDHNETDTGSQPITDFVWTVTIDTGTVYLEEDDRLPGAPSTPDQAIDQDIIVITSGDLPELLGNRAETYVYEESAWSRIVNQKTGVSQPPLFEMYDIDRNSLHNEFVYPNNNFRGSKIFSYKENTDQEALEDPILGFAVTYEHFQHTSDIIFENNISSDQFIYIIGQNILDITGYSFYRVIASEDDEHDSPGWETFNSWKKNANDSKQYVIEEYAVADENQTQYPISVNPLLEPSISDNINVIVNGHLLSYLHTVIATGDVVLSGDAVDSVSIIEVGDGYSTAPAVTFSGDGTGATGTAILTGNTVTSITIDTPGSGYTVAAVSIADPVAPQNSFDVEFASSPIAFSLVDITADLVTNDSVRIEIYSYDILKDEDPGYFEIPSQLEINPTNAEIIEFNYGDIAPHMQSIMANQIGFNGDPLGQNNNFRETAMDNSLGTFVVQNESSLLKTMLVSSSNELDFVTALRFAQNEYTIFKGNIQKTVKQMMNREFVPDTVTQLLNIDAWVEEAIDILAKSRMFSKAFAYSYMIARGTASFNETFISNGTGRVLQNYVDLSSVKNSMYVYKVDGPTETMMLVDIDYVISELYGVITIVFPSGTTQILEDDTIIVKMYEDPIPAYLPSSPAKLGCAPVYQPMIIEDPTYASRGVYMVLGHDGSKTPVFGEYQTVAGNIETLVSDYRDEVLLEIERRIYNGIEEKFRNDYDLLLRQEKIRPGKFRTIGQNRYSRQEYFDRITEAFFSRWTAEYNLDFKLNEFYVSSPESHHKTWNYSSQVDQLGESLPGNWRGIFDYFYDTQTPAETPWEMLGFSTKPSWWETEYGAGPWGSVASIQMWVDIEAGEIKDGIREGTDELFARPGMETNDWIPVDEAGNTRTVVEIFALSPSWNKKGDPWVYGDGAPVEYAWKSSSEYHFSELEFLYLMQPAEFGEKLWDPLTTGMNGDQFLNIATNTRAKNQSVIVHGEIVNEEITVSTGYQVYISDRLLFLNQNVTTTFGDKIRALTVNLAHKIAGFSNKDTMKLFLESVGSLSISGSRLIPNNNYQLLIHEGPSVKEYVYSGVIIRVLDNGKFSVHGYDLLSLEFIVMDRDISGRSIGVDEGGTPSSFTTFTFGTVYSAGDIVKHQSSFYQAAVSHEATTFISTNWIKLNRLPSVGGISVTYYPDRSRTWTRVQYGTIFKNHQEVFDFLIGYGDYLEKAGWEFSTVNQYNQIENWLTYAKKFLFWASSEWETDNVLFLSPNSEQPALVTDRGYPKNIERMANGVYSILSKFGTSIDPSNTIINRNDKQIQVIPTDPDESVYYLRVESSETEHVLLIDNLTDFEDVVYDPLFNARQNRLKLVGTITSDWFGKREAGGYLIEGDVIIPNLENQVNGIRDLYNTETFHDNVAAEEAARHLIGHETREYLDGLEVADDVQFSFYQGFIRQKGTLNAINKLLRSDNITDKDEIKIAEEWAVKQNEFGGLVDNTTIEVVVDFTQLKSDPQLLRLSHVPVDNMVVGEIKLFNREEFYEFAPAVFITNPERSLIPAVAVAILGSDRKIDRIEITHEGSGYIKPPRITISRSTISGVQAFSSPERNDSVTPNRDRAYATMHAFIPEDPTNDKIIDINIADTSKWILKPKDQDLEFTVPMTDRIDYQIPSAGYANINDVTTMAFSPTVLFNIWTATPLIPGNTCWIAKNILETWNVYKLRVHATNIILEDDGSEEALEDSGFANLRLPFDSPLPNNTRYDLLTASAIDTDGNSSLEIGIINLESPGNSAATDQPPTNELYQYVRIIPETVPGEIIDPEADVIYVLYDTENKKIKFSDVSNYSFSVNVFSGMRFATVADKEPWVEVGDTYWIDDVNGIWAVYREGAEPYYRRQEPLINSSFYENIFIRDRINNETQALLSVLDPFKGLIPGIAEQNIDFKTPSDPARYNVSDDEILLDPSSIFDDSHVGKTWWDLSAARVLYYEQPAINVTGRPVDVVEAEERKALAHAQEHWGNFFPGAQINIYEWVRSQSPPAIYTGDGTPKSLTDYVQLRRYNPDKDVLQLYYYFWVRGITEVPKHLNNRTTSITEVARILANPRRLINRWFAPVRSNNGKVSFLIANSNDILSAGTSVIQINYKNKEHALPEHVEWKLIHETNSFTPITEGMWNKLVDSLIGYTAPLSPAQYTRGVPLDTNDIRTAQSVVLPVPDPALSPSESLGILVRPQQSIFRDIFEARRTIVFTINELLADIKIWTTNPLWHTSITTAEYWEETDWFEDGYDAVTATHSRRVEVSADLYDPKLQEELVNGELIRVSQTSPGPNDRYEIFRYDNDTGDFTLIRRERGTARLKDSLYSGDILISLRSEFREILTALRDELFVQQLAVNVNKIYIAAIIYALSEQKEIDWAFKTTYITLIQEGRTVRQSQVFTPELQNEFISYINESKPYHTKLRKMVTTVKTETDVAVIDVPMEELTLHGDIRFERVSIETDPEFMSTQVIDSLTFKLDWESGSFDTGEKLIVINESTGEQSAITGEFSLGWDSLQLLSALGGDEDSFGDATTVRIDGETYIYPHNTPQELVPTKSLESLIITVDSEVIDGGFIERDNDKVIITTPISYTMSIEGTGKVNYVRNADISSTTLATDVDFNAKVIHVTDGGVFPSVIGLVPGAFRIGSERIEYFGKVGNVLTNIRRASQGTFASNHTAGEKIFVETGNVFPDNMTVLPQEFWYTEVNLQVDLDLPALAPYLDVDGKPGIFLKNGPGTANS